MIQRHIDSIKGYGSSAVSFAAVAVSHTTVISWLQITSLAVGIAVGLITFAEKIRKWQRQDSEKDQ